MVPDGVAIAGHWLGKHIPMATDTDAAVEELLKAVFSVWSMPRL
jgi:hypothetical protein